MFSPDQRQKNQVEKGKNTKKYRERGKSNGKKDKNSDENIQDFGPEAVSPASLSGCQSYQISGCQSYQIAESVLSDRTSLFTMTGGKGYTKENHNTGGGACFLYDIHYHIIFYF